MRTVDAAFAVLALGSTQGFVAPIVPARPLGGTSHRISSQTSMVSTASGTEYTASLPGAPFGLASDGKYFDPLGLAAKQSPEVVKRWREAELKHGRVAMLATLGIMVAEVFHPFFMGPVSVGPAIDHFQEINTVYPLFWVGTLMFVAFIEGRTILKGWGSVSPVTGEGNLKEDYYPGDLGFDPLGVAPRDGMDFRLMQSQELDLGRYAMIGVLGMLAQELVDGQGIIEHIISRV